LMDVEGSEEGVFASFDSALWKTPKIIIETGSYHSPEFLRLLDERYTIESLLGDSISINRILQLPSTQTLNVVLNKK